MADTLFSLGALSRLEDDSRRYALMLFETIEPDRREFVHILPVACHIFLALKGAGFAYRGEFRTQARIGR